MAGTQMLKIIFKKKNKILKVRLPDFRGYYEETITKTSW